jgi:hypothetical protein
MIMHDDYVVQAADRPALNSVSRTDLASETISLQHLFKINM